MEFVAPLVQNVRLLLAVLAEEDESPLVFVSEEPDGAACVLLLASDDPPVPDPFTSGSAPSPRLAAY